MQYVLDSIFAVHRSILSHGTAATAIQECCRLKPYARLSRRRLLIDKCAIVTGALQLQLAHPLLILLYFYFSAPLPHLNVVVGIKLFLDINRTRLEEEYLFSVYSARVLAWGKIWHTLYYKLVVLVLFPQTLSVRPRQHIAGNKKELLHFDFLPYIYWLLGSVAPMVC